MTFKIHETGYAMLARTLAGSGEYIDSMYVELDTEGGADVSVAFGPGRPYAEVPCAGTTKGGTVRFSGMARPDDFDNWKRGSRITRVTLVSRGVPVATSLIAPPVELVDGQYTAVSASINFGTEK